MRMMLFIIVMSMVMLTQSAVKRTFLSGCLLHLAHLDGLGVQHDEAARQGHGRHRPQDEVDRVCQNSIAVVKPSARLNKIGCR